MALGLIGLVVCSVKKWSARSLVHNPGCKASGPDRSFIPSTNILPAAWCNSGSPLGYSPYLQDHDIIWVTNFLLVGSPPGNALSNVNKRPVICLARYKNHWHGDIYPCHPRWDSHLLSHKPREGSNLSLPRFRPGLRVVARWRRGRARR